MSKKLISYIIHLGSLTLIAMSAIFYEERLIGNGGQDIYEVINYEHFFFIHNRFSHFFSQVLPLVAVKLNLPLKHVLLLFSISTPTFFYGLNSFVLHGLNKPKIAFIMFFMQTALVSFSFYFDPNLEIQFCMVSSLLFLALLQSNRINTLVFIPLTILLFFLIVLSYPPTALFLLAVILVEFKTSHPVKILTASLCLILFGIISYFTLDVYEHSLIVELSKAQTQLSFFENYIGVIAYYVNEGIVVTLIFVACLLILIHRKKTLAVSVILGTGAIYIALIAKYYSGSYQLQHIVMPLGFFVSLGILKSIRDRSKFLAYAILFAIVIKIQVNYQIGISMKETVFAEFHSLITSHAQENILLSDPQDSMEESPILVQLSLMLSSQDEKTKSTVLFPKQYFTEQWDNLNSSDWYILQEQYYIELDTLNFVEELFSTYPLNSRYFNLKNTTFTEITIQSTK